MIREKFLLYLQELQEKGVSQNSISEQLGVSSAVISQYKNNNYPGDVEKLEQKIASWLNRLELQKKRIQIPYVEITATKAIFKAIGVCQRDKDFSVIVGNAGLSKTLTAKRYIEVNKTGIYIKINQSTRGTMLRAIAKQLGIDQKGNTVSLYERIVHALTGLDTVLIVDEADYLKENCKELLRHISDDAGVGVCLIGLPRLEMQLVAESKEDYQQLVRRIGSFLNLNKDATYCIDDARKIMSSVWDEIDDNVVSAFFKASKGSVGTLTKLMIKADEIAKEQGRDKVLLEDLEVAKTVVMRAFNSFVRG